MAKKFYEFFQIFSQKNYLYNEVIANASAKVKAAFRKLQKYLEQCCSDWPDTSCPVSIDEAHTLYTDCVQDAESDYTLYSRFKSVLSEMVLEDLCIIFLSTATQVSKLAPSKEVAPSLCERDDEQLLPMELPC
jgi:hypothetical protein